MERLSLVKAVAVLGADHVSVEVLLCSPGGSVEEVHRSSEARGSHCALALGWKLHGVIMVDALVHIGDLLTEVVPRLEAGVAEGLSCCSGGHLGVPDARVSNGKGGLAVAIVDGVHSAIGTGDLGCVESIQRLRMSDRWMASNKIDHTFH